MTDYPETPAQLFDLCHELFGIGEYDEDVTATPWFKIRMNEIGKIKAFTTKRRIEIRTLGITALYCSDQGIKIRATGELIQHIPAALVALRQAALAAEGLDAQERIERAVRAAYEQGQDELAEEILRIPTAAASVALPDIEKRLGLGS